MNFLFFILIEIRRKKVASHLLLLLLLLAGTAVSKAACKHLLAKQFLGSFRLRNEKGFQVNYTAAQLKIKFS